MEKQVVDVQGLRSIYVELYHQTLEVLKRVELHLSRFEYAQAEGWLMAADNFFGKTAVLYFQLQKNLKSRKDRQALLEDMYDLQGNLEGARSVLREACKN